MSRISSGLLWYPRKASDYILLLGIVLHIKNISLLGFTTRKMLLKWPATVKGFGSKVWYGFGVWGVRVQGPWFRNVGFENVGFRSRGGVGCRIGVEEFRKPAGEDKGTPV